MKSAKSLLVLGACLSSGLLGASNAMACIPDPMALSRYQAAIDTDYAELTQAYTTLNTTYQGDVAAAAAQRDAELAQLGEGQKSDHSGNILNKAIDKYNHVVTALNDQLDADWQAANDNYVAETTAAVNAYKAATCQQ